MRNHNYSFLSSSSRKIKFDSVIKLANPLSEDLAILRPSLIPAILENIKINQAGEDEIAIYEIGGIFLNKAGEIKKDESGKEKLPSQEKRLVIALAGGDGEDLFRKLKGVIEFLLTSLNLQTTFEFEASKYNNSASVKLSPIILILG